MKIEAEIYHFKYIKHNFQNVVMQQNLINLNVGNALMLKIPQKVNANK